MARTTTPASDEPINLPGLGLARDAINVWSQLLTANFVSYEKLWGEARRGDITLKSVLGHSVGAVERCWHDLGQLIRTPFVDTDRPNWAIFWYDLDRQSGAMSKTVSLGRRYPTPLELHLTDLQMLGQKNSIAADYYDAKLDKDDGVTLNVQLKPIPKDSAEGDYVGLVTAKAAAAPLAVVMLTVRGPKKD